MATRKSPTKKRRGPGQPSRYNPEVHPAKAKELLSQGITKASIADTFGIHVGTYCEWQNRYPEFAEANKRGELVAVSNVENALYKKAMGFDGPDGKYYAPDNTAGIFYLKNRAPNDWRDRREVDASVKVTDMTEEQIKEQILNLLGDD